MPTRFGQRGFLLIAAVVLIAVAALMAVAIMTLTAGSGQAGGIHVNSTQALFVAESGLEKGIRQRSLSNAYAGEGPTAAGSGTFTVTTFGTDFAGAALPAGQRRIRSVGTVGNATRTIEAVVRHGAAMMVYAKESSPGVPFYRRWNNETLTWGAEAAANDVGPLIYYMVLKFARTRNEAILGVQDSAGAITIQVWNGTVWTAPMATCSTGAGNALYRGFDIEYETQTDRALIVCNNNVAAQASFGFWNGTALTFPAVGSPVVLTAIGAPRWIVLAANPLATSDEIVLLAQGLPDATADVYGMRWTGTLWSNMGAAGTWETNAATNTSMGGVGTRVIDVAYERQSGRAMFIWGVNAVGLQRYRIWDGTNLSGTNTLDLTNIPGNDMIGEAVWVRLVSNPGSTSNQLLYGVQDDQRDLFTAFWNGGAWASQIQMDTNVEDTGDRNFDVVFETHPNNVNHAWCAWGDTSGADFTRGNHWNGAAWLGQAPLTGTSEEAAHTRLVAHPASGAVFALVYEDTSSTTDDIAEYHLTAGGAVWTATAPAIWGGPTVANPVRQRIAIAAERHIPIVSWREVFP